MLNSQRGKVSIRHDSSQRGDLSGMAINLHNGPILVAGATGRQGGAVARHLLQHEFRVHGMTRHPQSEAAVELRGLGAKVVQADMDDTESLKAVTESVHGVFSVQNYWEVGAEREIAEGRRVADVAQASGVQFIVYSSVGGAERNTGIEHFDSKFEIETHVRSLPMAWCILRPVWFMENLLVPAMRDALMSGTLAFPLPPDIPLQMVAVNDIGVLAAMAFMQPVEWSERALEIAGAEHTMPEVAEILSDHLGRRVEFQEVSLEDARQQQGEDAATMYEWFVEEGYQADIEALRLLHPQLMDLRQWLNVRWPARVGAEV